MGPDQYHQSFASAAELGPAPLSGAPARVLVIPQPALAFWLSTAVLLAFSQFWVSVFEDPLGGVVDAAVSARLRTFYLIPYALVVALAAPRIVPIGRLVMRAPALALLLVLAVASLAWTIDFGRTERRLVALMLTTLFGLYLAERFNWAEITRMFAIVFLIIMSLSFGYALGLPLYGRMQVDFPGAWRGVYDHKNALGYAMSVALVIFIGAFVFNPRQRPLWAAAGAAAIVLLLLSTSKTALVSGGVAIVALTLPIVGRRSPAAAIAATLAAGTAFYLFLMVLAVDVGAVFALLGKDESFTGRTQIWAVVSKEISENPLFGFGYGAIWEKRDVWSPLLAMEKSLGFILPEAHNSWLQIALDLGYVGAALWTAVFVGSWIRTLAFLYTRPASLFVFPFLIVFTLHAVTEAGALLQNDIVWILFTLITVRLGNEHRLLTPTLSERDAAARPAPILL